MITKDGYSKDRGILPEGVAITFGVEMMPFPQDIEGLPRLPLHN